MSLEQEQLILWRELTGPPQRKESKEVCGSTTQDTGWHVVLDCCLEARSYRFLHSRVCQHQDLEVDTSSHGQLDEYVNTVCECLCVSECVS